MVIHYDFTIRGKLTLVRRDKVFYTCLTLFLPNLVVELLNYHIKYINIGLIIPDYIQHQLSTQD